MNNPGTFKAERWDDGDYVVTCSVGPIGHTSSNERDAQRMAEWLNTAIPELLRKLEGQPTPEEDDADPPRDPSPEAAAVVAQAKETP